MRVSLRPLVGQTHRFIGKVERFSRTTAMSQPTILCVDLMKHNTEDEWEYVSDHMWLKYTLGMEKLCLKCGDVVMFYAKVEPYISISQGGVNYGLNNVARSQKVVEQQTYARKLARAKQRLAREASGRVRKGSHEKV